MQPLDIGETLKRGWDTFVANVAPMIVGMILVSIVSGVSLGICAGPMMVGFAGMCLRAARGEKVEIGDVFAGFSMFGPAFILSVLLVVAGILGAFTFGLVTLAAMFLFFWAPYLMADGDTDAISCCRRSMQYNMANLGPALLFFIVNAIVASIGSAVAIGSLITGPVASDMMAHGYLSAFGGGTPGAPTRIAGPGVEEQTTVVQ